MLKNRILKRVVAVVCSAALLLPVGDYGRSVTSRAFSASTAVSEEIGLVGNLFCVADSSAADHAALQWATTLPAESYTLYRRRAYLNTGAATSTGSTPSCPCSTSATVRPSTSSRA